MLLQLLKIGKALLAETAVDRVLGTALDGVIELCGAERGMILLFDASREVQFEEARNLGKEDIEHPEFEVSRSVIARVRADGETFWRANLLDDPTLGRKASVRRLGILSVICQPIRHGGEAFGLVYLDSRSAASVFTTEAVDLVESFSDFISLAAHNALERRRLSQRISHLAHELRQRYDFQAIVGYDPKMVELLKLVAQVADSEATVLIRGESGTGKELIARAVHWNSSRRDGPFVAVNCAALPENLLEAELFGHLRGAFTGATRERAGWFERAQGGTILLDEIGELQAPLQVKLLRVLENGEYSRVGSTQVSYSDARVVAATNQDLDELVRRGQLRQDFLFRLNVVELEVPPLRERPTDILVLAQHFLAELNEKYPERQKRLSPAAQEVLLRYEYPGNVRELRHALERALLVADGGEIEPRHLPKPLRRPGAGSTGEGRLASFKAAKEQAVERFERDYLTRCLRASGGNISQAAKAVGLDYKNFYTKMTRYGIDPAAFKRPDP